MIEAGVLEGCDSETDTFWLERLFDAHHDRLYRLARRLSTRRDEAHDLVQETFVRAALKTARVPRGAHAEEAWLVRVLVNLARDRWRREKVRATCHWRADDRSSPPPERALLARIEVQRALGALGPRRRAVVVLHELEGLETATISRLLGISAVTVRWHLSRGRAELARVLHSFSVRSPSDERQT